LNFKIEGGEHKMKVIWLRKQYEAYWALQDAAWRLQSHAVNLKSYLRGADDQALSALDDIERIAIDISQAIREGDSDEVKRLAEEAAQKRSIVAQAMEKVGDEGARQSFLAMSDAIRELGGY
jgi:hypothetical protein